MEFLDFIKAGEILIGLMLTGIGALAGFFAWWSRKNRAYADGVKKDMFVHHGTIERRLVEVESQLSDVADEVDNVKDHVQRLEKDMGGLACKEDLGDIKATIAAHGATTKRMGTQLDTLYRAALAVSQRDQK